jgi:allophanate hydrolase subunit 1
MAKAPKTKKVTPAQGLRNLKRAMKKYREARGNPVTVPLELPGDLVADLNTVAQYAYTTTATVIQVLLATEYLRSKRAKHEIPTKSTRR